MRIVVVGAGVVGSVYAARLAAAGHEVTVVARGRRREALETDGLRVRTGGRVVAPDIALAPPDGSLPPADLIIVTVRANQLDPVLDLLTAAPHPTVAFLQHLGSRASEVVARVGAERVVLAFPGIGGLIDDDGVVAGAALGGRRLLAPRPARPRRHGRLRAAHPGQSQRRVPATVRAGDRPARRDLDARTLRAPRAAWRG